MNDNKIETILYRGYKIETFYDIDAQSPNKWGNDDAFLVYDHRDFWVKRDGFDPQDIWDAMQDKHNQRKLYDGYWVYPLYAYIHSGVSLSLGKNSYPFTCPWDTSMKGFVLIRRDKGTWSEVKARRVALSVVEEWNQYLGGEVYGYNHNAEAGSCWGFYGDEGMKQMIEEAKGEIDYHIKQEQSKHYNQLKTWIRNRVPLSKRQSLILN